MSNLRSECARVLFREKEGGEGAQHMYAYIIQVTVTRLHFVAADTLITIIEHVQHSLWQLAIGGMRNPDSGSAGKWNGRWPNAKWNCCCCPRSDNTAKC